MPAKARNLDFTNVKERAFSPKHLPEGDYPAKVTKVEDYESNAGNAQWLFTIQITSGPGKGATYPLYCGLDAKNLWKFRNLAVACGINVPKSKVKSDPNKLVGKECGITLEDDEYEGKPKSVIAATIPLSEVAAPDVPDADDDDEEHDAPTKKSGKKDKKGKKGKKGKAVSDDEMEELEVEEL